MRLLIFIVFLNFFVSCVGQKNEPPKSIHVDVPTSVSTSTSVDKSVLIILTKDGKVYLFLNDLEQKDAVLNNINKIQSLNLNDVEIEKLKKMEFIGLPFIKLKEALNLNESIPASKMDGIPVSDSANNELTIWIKAITENCEGIDVPHFVLKADIANNIKIFEKIKQSLKENQIYKFRLVSTSE